MQGINRIILISLFIVITTACDNTVNVNVDTNGNIDTGGGGSNPIDSPPISEPENPVKPEAKITILNSIGSLNDNFLLDGSESSDANGDNLTFHWRVVSKPVNSNVDLSLITENKLIINYDEPGIYTFGLVVNDGTFDSDEVEVEVQVNFETISLGTQIIEDAIYSEATDKILIVTSSPASKLLIIDPTSNSTSEVNLPVAPTSIDVSQDGIHAIVGHNGFISHVDLSNNKILNTYSTTADAFDVVLAPNNYAYVIPRIDQWETIRSINLTDGIETLHTGYPIRAGSKARLHPSGNSLYVADRGLSPSDIEKYDISSGTAAYLYDSPYHGDYAMCGNLWLYEDGTKIITACSNLFNSTTLQSSDMTYYTALEGITYVESAVHSKDTFQVAAIEMVHPYISSDSNLDTKVHIFDHTYLQKLSTFDFATTADINNMSSHMYHGKFIFFSSDGTKVYVLASSDQSPTMNVILKLLDI